MYLHTESTRPAAGIVAKLNGVADLFAHTIDTVVKAFEGHRAARKMAALDDRILEDIGLSRADVEQAVLSPLFSDPRQDLAIARQFRIRARNRPLRRRH